MCGVSGQVDEAVAVLRSGGLVAVPTESVWGLSCDPDNAAALDRLLHLKGRDSARGVILVADDMQRFAPLLDGIDSASRQQLCDSWPGPMTWLVSHRGLVSSQVCGDSASVALRVTAHPVLALLCRCWGAPLVSTSANRSGALPCRTAEEVEVLCGDALGVIVPGELGAEPRPTPIRDLLTGAWQRR